MTKNLEAVLCPYCGSGRADHWANELGFAAVRCQGCAIIYCNPRPVAAEISAAVRAGSHTLEGGNQQLNVKARRINAKVQKYRRLFASMFADIWVQPVSWLDVGAGYGEILEAVKGLAALGSQLEGLEPMTAKVQAARVRGLNMTQDYLRADHAPVDVISLVDVFSHVPDFGALLDTARQVLKPGGKIFVETGNLADLEHRHEFPGELGLPDHLVFAGEQHIVGFLERNGFEISAIDRQRIDGFGNLAKNAVKKLLGRPASFGVPYRSAYRQIRVRARLR